MQFPASELEYWSLFFSIDDNKDKPIQPDLKLTSRQAKSRIREVFNNAQFDNSTR